MKLQCYVCFIWKQRVLYLLHASRCLPPSLTPSAQKVALIEWTCSQHCSAHGSASPPGPRMFHVNASSRWFEWVNREEGDSDERGRVRARKGTDSQDGERQTWEVQWWGGHCTSTGEMEERGREWGKGETQGLHWHILIWAHLRAIKPSASPSLSFHPYRPVAAVSCVQLVVPVGFRHISVNLAVAGILGVQRYPLSEARDLERKGEARRRLDRAAICVSSQRYGSSPHAPLLAASYSLSFCFSISPSRSTHTCSCCMATTC